MIYNKLRGNKEMGKLLQYAYDLHKNDMEDFVFAPRFEYYSGYGLYEGREYKDGIVYGEVIFDNHSDCYALISMVTILELDSNGVPNGSLFMQANTEDYDLSFSRLCYDADTNKLNYDKDFWDVPDSDKINTLIDHLVFLNFRREDVIKVINGQMTAKEAFQNVAPKEMKNKQWICENRKFYEFDGNVAIGGDYGSITTDNFPFPFDGQPILDCSKVKTAGVRLNLNKRRIKLINVNSNPKSIYFTDLREAIIDEVIDASKVRITGTRFGDQKVINLDKSIDFFDEDDLALAHTDTEEVTEKPKKHVEILSNASNVDAMIDGLSNGASGIGLFRDEVVLERNPVIVSRLLEFFIDWDICMDDDPILDVVYEDFYNNAAKMYSLSGDKPIVFRLSDMKTEEFVKRSDRVLNEEEKRHCDNSTRGIARLYSCLAITLKEIRAIIKAAKAYNKPVNILIPYFQDINDIKDMKNKILQIANEENYTNVRVGAMIENIETVHIADEVALYADFISIGTNDLTESVLNKKRSINDVDFSVLNEQVKEYIKKIVYRVKRKRDIPINICGEHANNLDNMDFYLSLDIDTITCNPNLVSGYLDFLSRYYEVNDQGRYLRKETNKKK